MLGGVVEEGRGGRVRSPWFLICSVLVFLVEFVVGDVTVVVVVVVVCMILFQLLVLVLKKKRALGRVVDIAYRNDLGREERKRKEKRREEKRGGSDMKNMYRYQILG